MTALVLVVAACERGPAAESPQAAEARRDAARDACVAAELANRAYDNLETLAAFAAEGSLGQATAAVEFARAYLQHALLRHASIARVDSAANHARDSADSLRFVEAAAAFQPGRPDPETVEANVSAAYTRDFVEMRSDEDHRCNWAI